MPGRPDLTLKLSTRRILASGVPLHRGGTWDSKAGIVHLIDGRVSLQPACDFQRAVILSSHAQAECLHASEQVVGIGRTQGSAVDFAEVIDLLDELAGFRKQRLRVHPRGRPGIFVALCRTISAPSGMGF